MVISVEVANFSVRKTLIDKGSSTVILYYSTFQKSEIPKSAVMTYDNKLVEFAEEYVDTRGYVDLLTTFGNGTLSRTISVRYLIVNAVTSTTF